jgi:hypothetical protein
LKKIQLHSAITKESIKMCDDKIEKWQSMIKKIIEELSGLRTDQFIFRGYMEILESNPALPKNNLFVVWAWRNYLFTAAMGVRRQLSSRYEDISLVNLLEDIKKEPTLLSRTRYTSLYKGTGFENDIAYINDCFDKLVGKGKESLDSADIALDIDQINEIAKALKVYSNKTIAHAGKDAESIETLPTIKDLNDSIDMFERMLNKYYGILNAGGIELPKFAQVAWESVFLIPWKLN